jgi:hypothetical protein
MVSIAKLNVHIVIKYLIFYIFLGGLGPKNAPKLSKIPKNGQFYEIL